MDTPCNNPNDLREIQPMTAKQRVAVELRELTEKHDKLGSFIGTDKFFNLDIKQQRLLRAQFGAMSSYMWILWERLETWKD